MMLNMRGFTQVGSICRSVLRRGGSVPGVLRLFWRILRRDGFLGSVRTARDFLAGSADHHDRNNYGSWVAQYDTLTPDDIVDLSSRAAALRVKPLISILMPTYNTPREWLIEAIESVRRQVYVHWELCIADDASNQPHVREVLEDYASRDERIKICLRPKNGHICATTNSALDMATGEWLALLDHDDVLPAGALYWTAESINRYPDCQLIYSDEDKISEAGVRFGPYFKPDWNPDLFRSQNMFSHLGVFKTHLVKEVGGFREGYEGSQDYDLALRCVERVRRDQVIHVPRVLYHWRVHQESTAHSAEAKPYAYGAAERALNDHLARTGAAALAARDEAGYRIRYGPAAEEPLVAVIVSGTGDSRARQRCVQSLLDKTSYGNYLVFVEGVSGSGEGGGDDRVRVVDAGDGAFAAAARRVMDSGCSLVCLVDESAEFANADWLSELVSHARRSNVGIVAPKLVFRNGKIASGGIVIKASPIEGAGDSHRNYPASSNGYGGRARLVQCYSAVRSTCAVMRLEVFRTGLPAFQTPGGTVDLEMCSRIAAQGLDIVWTPYAEVMVHRPLPPLVWPSSLPEPEGNDPAYNPNLHEGEIDFSLAWPPRLEYFGDERGKSSDELTS